MFSGCVRIDVAQENLKMKTQSYPRVSKSEHSVGKTPPRKWQSPLLNLLPATTGSMVIKMY